MLTVRIIRKDGAEERRNYQGTLESCRTAVDTLINTHLTQDPECRIVSFDDQTPQEGETVLHDGLPTSVEAPEQPAPPKRAQADEPEEPAEHHEPKAAHSTHKKAKGR